MAERQAEGFALFTDGPYGIKWDPKPQNPPGKITTCMHIGVHVGLYMFV